LSSSDAQNSTADLNWCSIGPPFLARNSSDAATPHQRFQDWEQLSGEPMSYLDIAARLGQHTDRLKAGESVQTQVQIASLEEFRELFAGHFTVDQRATHGQYFVQNHVAAQAGQPSRHHFTRLAHHVYGDAPLSAADAQLAEKTFPIRVNLISKADYCVEADIVFGPSASPVVLNVGTLTFNGGTITTRNTVLALTADTLAFGTNPGTRPHHIGIMGVDGTAGSPGTDGPSVPRAASGSDALPTSPGICTGAGNGGVGSDGEVGNPGGAGGNGDDGRASLPATITIGAFADPNSKLVLYARSGAGGNGGKGGRGGKGQQGGSGGSGCNSGCEGTDGGKAGSGGKGGAGGNGGNGGHAVNGFNVTVHVPAAMVENVVTSAEVAPFGQAGDFGLGGDGGAPGAQGKGGKHSTDGSTGMQGDPGNEGHPGKPGTHQGSPGHFFINGT
jgi:hypothetical protein